VAEESFPIGHHANDVRSDMEDRALRLTILHAWVWQPNPEGLFATDNWTLPFVRLGVPPRSDWSPAATRALALATDGEEYYSLMLRTSMALTADEETIATGIISQSRKQASRELARVRRERRLARAQQGCFSVLWSGMWEELERALPQRLAQLRVLRHHLERTPAG
jgi:hypothetical protein